jgi:hypothetical protein
MPTRKPESDGLCKGTLLVDIDLSDKYNGSLWGHGPIHQLIYIDRPGVLVIEGTELRFWGDGAFKRGADERTDED